MTTSLRHIARCVLVLSLVLSTQSLLMVKVAFEVRQDYVIEKFCVNRDRPELKCEGYCHFSCSIVLLGCEANSPEDDTTMLMLDLEPKFGTQDLSADPAAVYTLNDQVISVLGSTGTPYRG